MGNTLTLLGPVIRAAGFWSAVCLPWVALGFVVTGEATARPLWFVGIVLAAGIAAVIGKEHTIE
jgi:hypothetical protein